METMRGQSAEFLLRQPEAAVKFIMEEKRCSAGKAKLVLARHYPALYNALRRKQNRDDLAKRGL
jgi:hypothetical protein